MRTITKQVYAFEEINAKAKERAIEEHTEDQDPWSTENFESLAAVMNLLNVKVKNASYARYESEVDYSTVHIEDTILDMSGARLMSYLHNKVYDDVMPFRWSHIGNKSRVSRIYRTWDCCPLTGQYLDHDLIEPIIKVLSGDTCKRNPGYSYTDLIAEIAHTWEGRMQENEEDRYSEEYFREYAESSRFYFSADGAEVYGEDELDPVN